MRLHELTAPTWFITVAEKQKLGSIIERMNPAFPLGGFLEEHVERRRPEQRLSRADSFYLIPQPASSGGFVYEVEPIGVVECQHTGWLRLLRGAVQTSIGELDQYATGYWSNKEVPELRDAPWEHRVAKVKLLKCVASPGPRPCVVH